MPNKVINIINMYANENDLNIQHFLHRVFYLGK